MLKCPRCGGRVDLTKDGDWGHCADCNNIIEIKKVKDEDDGKADADEPVKEGGSAGAGLESKSGVEVKK